VSGDGLRDCEIQRKRHCLGGEKRQNPGVPFAWRTRKVMWLENPLEISAWQRGNIFCAVTLASLQMKIKEQA
jgi:hypothetical protein